MYKNQLGAAIKEAEEQKRLREKYKVEDKNTKIVEKSNMIKFTIKSIGSIIKISANILVIILAAIGILALYYPVPRQGLLDILNTII